MKRRLAAWVISAGLLGLGAIAIAREWRETLQLRPQIERLRAEADELASLKAENQRLRARQVSAEELAAHRSDHAALPRLRRELEALRRSGTPETPAGGGAVR